MFPGWTSVVATDGAGIGRTIPGQAVGNVPWCGNKTVFVRVCGGRFNLANMPI